MTLQYAFEQLSQAVCPEDVFGDLNGDPAESLKKEYREWAKVCHTDAHPGKADKKLAHEAFVLLEKWLGLAEARVKDGRYGDRSAMDQVTVETKGNVYTITERVASGDLCEVYGGHDKGKADLLFKVVRNPRNSDLVLSEQRTLHYFWNDAPSRKLKVMAHIPELVDSFELQQTKIRKRVNVFKRLRGFYPLTQVREAYPNGLDPRDAAWMFNRLLGALLAAHQNKMVHGAVTPDHFLVSPEGHNGVLVDWSYAVKIGEPIKAVAPAWRDFYPPEVFKKAPASVGVDIYMAAYCFLYLLGYDWKKSRYIGDAPPLALRGMIKACLLGPRHRPDNVYDLHQEFRALLKQLYGPRKFRPLAMPKKDLVMR